jgi:hypothetical protein
MSRGDAVRVVWCVHGCRRAERRRASDSGPTLNFWGSMW